jgi:hypothetical protein
MHKFLKSEYPSSILGGSVKLKRFLKL